MADAKLNEALARKKVKFDGSSNKGHFKILILHQNRYWASKVFLKFIIDRSKMRKLH